MKRFIYLLLIIPTFIFCQTAPTTKDITFYRGDAIDYEMPYFLVSSADTAYTYRFGVKANLIDTTAYTIYFTSANSRITYDYSSLSRRVTLTLHFEREDTWSKSPGSYYYDIEKLKKSDTTQATTVFTGSFILRGDIVNPFSNTEGVSDTTRNLLFNPDNVQDGEFIKRSGDTWEGDSILTTTQADSIIDTYGNLTDSLALKASKDTLSNFVKYSDSTTIFVTSKQLADTSSAIRKSVLTADTLSYYYTKTETDDSLVAKADTNLSNINSTNALTNLGLNNVDNTSDLNKPVSTAVQDSLNTKASKDTLSNFLSISDSTTGYITFKQLGDTATAIRSASVNFDTLSYYYDKDSTKSIIGDTATALRSELSGGIGNATSIQGITVDTIGIANNYGLFYNSATGNFEFQLFTGGASTGNPDSLANHAGSEYLLKTELTDTLSTRAFLPRSEFGDSANVYLGSYSTTAEVQTMINDSLTANLPSYLLKTEFADSVNAYLSSYSTITQMLQAISDSIALKQDALGFTAANDDSVYHKSQLYRQGQIDTALSSKQDALVSGTNIKTINSTSILGSGDISITATTSDSVNTLYMISASKILYADSLTSDETYMGSTVFRGTLGATIGVGDLCYLDATSMRWELIDCTDTTHCDRLLGLCLIAGGDGDTTHMLIDGRMRSAAFPFFTAPGAPVYIGPTAGDITATKPTTTGYALRILGYAVTQNDFYFKPSNDYMVLK